MDWRKAGQMAVPDLLDNIVQAADTKNFRLAEVLLNAALYRSKGEGIASHMRVLDQGIELRLQMRYDGTAFKDAKSMIRLDSKDGRGYLRCGHIAKKQNNLPLAISYLEKGVETVATSRPDYASLSQELVNARREWQVQLFSKVKDPLNILPLELLEFVLSYLKYSQLVRMLQLSKSWNRILPSTRAMVETLALPFSKKYTPKRVATALKRLKCPKTIKAGPLPIKSAQTLMEALQRENFSTVEHLDLWGDWYTPGSLPLTKFNLKSLSIGGGCVVSLQWACEVVTDCPSLQTANIHVNKFSPSPIFTLDSTSLQNLRLDASAVSANGQGFQHVSLRSPMLEFH